MAESTPGGRAAAFVVAGIVFAGIIAGTVIPNVITQTHVEYGTWPGGTDFASVRCEEGTVYIADGQARQVARLPTVADAGGPYCVYRACFTPDQIPAADAAPTMPDPAMDPLFAEAEVPYTNGWPPLSVWCGDTSASAPLRCTCKDSLGADVKMPCGRLAGKDDGWLPAACRIPNCTGRTCGPDGAGGSCGTCSTAAAPDGSGQQPLTCDGAAGRCCIEPPCTPPRTPFPAGWTAP